MTDMSMLDGKVALVTGASSGIGRATAKVMAGHGAKVVLAARRESDLQSLAEEIKNSGGEVAYIKTDVTNETEVEALVKFAVSEFGRLDCAANNAGGGFQSDGEWHETSPEAFAKTFDLNVNGVWYCIKHEVAQMLEQGSGAIVNTSSIAGFRFTASEGYSSSKYAVNGMTAAAAARYGTRGIRVNAVAPGIIDAGSWAKRFADDPSVRTDWNSAIPIGRPGNPEEVGEAIAWLCSDAASYVTGVTLPVDGGNLITINRPDTLG